MFRALFKSRTDLNGPSIADFGVLSAEISEDKTQNASSEIVVDSPAINIQNGDILIIYDSYGTFYYWGKVTSIKPDTEDQTEQRVTTISASQFESIFDDNHLILPQTTTNQQSFFKNKTVSDVLGLYLESKELGYQSIKNTMSDYIPTYSGLVDIDTRNTYKGLRNVIIDSEALHVPYPVEKETVNLEEYLYESFDSYNRIIRPFIANPVLPSEYQRLEYIESDGTSQYIDTGVSPASYLNSLRIELDAQFTDISRTGYLLSSGYYNSTAANRKNILIGVLSTDSTFRMLNGNQTSQYVSLGAADTNRHLFVIDQTSKYYKIYNNIKFTSTVSSSLVNNIILFAKYDSDNSGSAINSFCSGRIYGCKIYNNGTLIKNLVPCFRKSDDEIGMYDLVSSAFLTNSGPEQYRVNPSNLEGAEGELIDYSSSGDDILVNPGLRVAFDKSKSYSNKQIGLAIFNPVGVIEYAPTNSWDYTEKTLFDTMETISNLSVVDEDVETNTVCIYTSDGSSLTGSFTILTNGDIQEISTLTPVQNRLGTGKTKFVFDDRTDNASVNSIVKANIPEKLFDHNITFGISFNDKNRFLDFNLGQRIKFYHTRSKKPDKCYESILSGWKYSIDQYSDTIKYAEFSLGKVRKNLTSKINRKVKKKK